MRTIKEEIKRDNLFENILLESVFERHMSMVINQFKKYSTEYTKDTKEFFKKLGFAVDKIDASRVTVIDYIDSDAEKEINSALDDKNKVIFGLMRNPSNKEIQVAAAYVPKLIGYPRNNPWLYLPTKEGHKFDTWECNRDNPLKVYEETAKRNIIKTFKHCIEVWIVDISGTLAVDKLQKDRSNAKFGMWENTPEFYAKVAAKNIERYKQMAAKLKMEKGSDFDVMMKNADEMVKKMYEVLMDMHNNLGEKQWGQNRNLSYLASEFNDQVSNMLKYVKNVIDEQRDYEDAKIKSAKFRKEHPELSNKNELDDGVFSEGWYLRRYREAINDVNEYRQRAMNYYNKLMEGIKEFKENRS